MIVRGFHLRLVVDLRFDFVDTALRFGTGGAFQSGAVLPTLGARSAVGSRSAAAASRPVSGVGAGGARAGGRRPGDAIAVPCGALDATAIVPLLVIVNRGDVQQTVGERTLVSDVSAPCMLLLLLLLLLLPVMPSIFLTIITRFPLSGLSLSLTGRCDVIHRQMVEMFAEFAVEEFPLAVWT